MANPNTPLSPLNRLKASVIFSDYTALNVTPSFLMPEAIMWTPEGNATTDLPALTGVVKSPEPFMQCRVALHLVRTLAIANAWKRQLELNTLLGDATIRPDAPSMDPWTVSNISITNVDAMGFGGRDAGFTVNLSCTWQINSALWN